MTIFITLPTIMIIIILEIIVIMTITIVTVVISINDIGTGRSLSLKIIQISYFTILMKSLAIRPAYIQMKLSINCQNTF